METLLVDLRSALRGLVKSPGFTLATIVTLTLGIGANTAIFSLVNGVLLDPLPYKEGERLVLLQQSAPKADVDNLAFSIREVYDYRDQNRTLEALVEHHSMTFTLLGREEPERVSTGVVSAEFFDVLGVTPALGRSFRPEDDDLGAEAVLILSDGYWQRSFGGDESVVGTVLEMNDRTHTVVGVLPPIPQFPVEHDVYMPTSACPFRAANEERMNENRSAFRAMTAFGRIRDGITVDAVRADFATIAAGFENDYPDTYPEEAGLAITATPLQEALTSGARTTLFILLGTSALVLFIACANVANLAMARIMRRDREMAVRSSLGAGLGKLVQQNLVEAGMLSLVGGALGLVLAYQGLGLLTAFLGRFTPRAVGITIDGGVLAFTLAVSLLTALVVGLLPVLASKPSLAAALRDGTHTTEQKARVHLRGLLIAGQVALAVVLLVGAGLMLRSLYRLQRVQPGFRTENVLLARMSPNWSRFQNQEDAGRFFVSLLDRVRAIPGVMSAGVGSGRPLDDQPPFTSSFRIENIEIREGELAPQVATRVASPDYFRTLGIPLLSGRTFTELDDQDSTPVGVLNRSLSEQFWTGRNPIGERISLDDGENWITVVGIVGDVREQTLDTEPVGAIYLPQAQSFWAQTLVVRTPYDPMTIARQVEEAVHAIDPEQPVDRFETLEQSRRASMASPRVTALLLGLFAALALVISATGIAGVISYSVSQRTHEIGIRMALGARRSQVLALVLRQGLLIVAMGLAVGVAVALAASRVLTDVLFETSPADPLTFAAVLVVLLGAALVASLIPARRAATLHPTVALRSE
ncbi:MAG TPA: ABC transporter permease [Vicinamibacteria bacterium]|nr:ABC transporter permease [Vicinamibacteria bacterium]